MIIENQAKMEDTTHTHTHTRNAWRRLYTRQPIATVYWHCRTAANPPTIISNKYNSLSLKWIHEFRIPSESIQYKQRMSSQIIFILWVSSLLRVLWCFPFRSQSFPVIVIIFHHPRFIIFLTTWTTDWSMIDHHDPTVIKETQNPYKPPCLPRQIES